MCWQIFAKIILMVCPPMLGAVQHINAVAWLVLVLMKALRVVTNIRTWDGSGGAQAGKRLSELILFCAKRQKCEGRQAPLVTHSNWARFRQGPQLWQRNFDHLLSWTFCTSFWGACFPACWFCGKNRHHQKAWHWWWPSAQSASSKNVVFLSGCADFALVLHCVLMRMS